mgnify:FL=1
MGKRNLETAIAQSGLDVTVRWLPFRMRPDVPAEGLGTAPRMYLDPSYVARVQAAGAKLGLEYSHKCRQTPNTLLAHTLIDLAGETSVAKQNEIAEVVFRQYHTDGLYPDETALVSAAVQVGLDAEVARAAITSETRQQEVTKQIRANAHVGGVPCFIVNGKPALSGAQPPAAFLETLKSF